MSDDLKMVRNPAYAGIQPQLLEPACHDRSPMLTVRCSCGGDSHLHETQLKDLPWRETTIGIRCSGCQEPMLVSIKTLRDAFDQMRKEGWSR